MCMCVYVPQPFWLKLQHWCLLTRRSASAFLRSPSQPRRSEHQLLARCMGIRGAPVINTTGSPWFRALERAWPGSLFQRSSVPRSSRSLLCTSFRMLLCCTSVAATVRLALARVLRHCQNALPLLGRGGGPPSAVAATPLTSRRDPSRPTSLTPSTCRVALSARSLERRLLGMSALLPLARWRPTMSMRACVTFPIMASLIMMVVVWLMASRVDPHGSVGNLLTATRVLNVRFNPLCEQFFIGDRFEKLVDYCVLIAHLRLDVGAS